MHSKAVTLSILVAVALMASAPVVFADRYSGWFSGRSGVQYQYVNQFGGKDWDGMRWHNGNSRKVAVHYKMKLRDGRTTKHLIYLEKGETSAIISISEGERVASVTVRTP